MNKVLPLFVLVFFIATGTLMATEEDAQAMLTKVVYQDLEGLKELIASGIDINIQDEMQGNTALIVACTYGLTDIAKYLISAGADVNIQNTMYGQTALFGAAYSSQELVELLLANGADIHIKSKEGTTAFTLSVVGVLGGSMTTDAAALLLERGADVDETSDTGAIAGYTCLMMAARNANPELVKFLLANGADVNAKAKDGSTPLGLARKENDEAMVALLVANGATE